MSKPFSPERETRLLRNRLGKLVDLLDEIYKAKKPADSILDDYFRVNRAAGSTDRRFYRDHIYAILRQNELLSFIIEQSNLEISARNLVVAYFVRHNIHVDVIKEFFDPDLVEKLATTIHENQTLPTFAQLNLPRWIYDSLSRRNDTSELSRIAGAINQEAPLDIRINPIKTDRDSVAKKLVEQKIDFDFCPYSPIGLRLHKRIKLSQLAIFRDGLIEVQDEGSQLLALLVDTKPSYIAIDFCAGAGGKSLLLAGIQKNTGKVIALDVSAQRLARMKPRIERGACTNIELTPITSESDGRLEKWKRTADRVLVDAPCSGSGTLRRNPELRLHDVNIEQLATEQLSILSAASTLVKKDGRLIYATCSLLAEENEQVVEKFLATHTNFRVLPIQAILNKLAIPIKSNSDSLQLLPHQHNTDGFFVCVMQCTSP